MRDEQQGNVAFHFKPIKLVMNGLDQSQRDQSGTTVTVKPRNVEVPKESVGSGHRRDDFQKTY